MLNMKLTRCGLVLLLLMLAAEITNGYYARMNIPGQHRRRKRNFAPPPLPRNNYQVNNMFAGNVVLDERPRGHPSGFALPRFDVRPLRPPRPINEFVTLSSYPTTLQTDFKFTVAYNCKRPAMIVVYVTGYVDDDVSHRNDSNPFLAYDPKIVGKRRLVCRPNHQDYATKRQLSISVQPQHAQRPSLVMPTALDLHDVKLKAMMVDLKFWEAAMRHRKSNHHPRHIYHMLFDQSKIKLNTTLEVPPREKRDEPNKCLSWQYQIFDKKFRDRKPLSHHDDDCMTMVDYPIIMAEEPYGVIKTFHSYRNKEKDAIAKIGKIRMTFTATFYLMSWCKSNEMCSIVQHVNTEDKLETPVILINKLGQLQIQMKSTNNKTYAHVTPFSVPIKKWIKLDFKQTNSLINITVKHGDNFSQEKKFVALFRAPIKFVYDDGYLLVGGSLFCRNIDGIVAESTICRNKIDHHISNQSAPDTRLWKNLATNFNRESQMKKLVRKSYDLHHHRKPKLDDVSVPYFLEAIAGKYSTVANKQKQQICGVKQPPTTREERFSKLDSIIKSLPGDLSHKGLEDQTTNQLLEAFMQSLEKMEHFNELESHLGLLKQAAMLGQPLAHYYLYVVYKNGIGLPRNMNKARYHLLSGARLNDRLCIKTLGYHHFVGINGFPQSDEYSIYYYLNAAHKTQKDLMEHSEKMTSVNTVRLTDEAQMKTQLDKDEDLFEWIKLQASKGVNSAQRNMGRLLYWGQQGLQRNLQEAFKYYEKAAETGDAAALYDYGVVLVKGHGTDENVDKGIGLLRKAAEQDNPGALNTLGWYYSVKEVNLTKAVEYFDRSDALGSPDAAYNLGHLYHTGQHPDGRDLKQAFLKYYRAASRGHVESCLQVAYFYNVGIKNFLPSNPYVAAQWAKYLTDKNPVMGEIIRQALQAFRKQFWAKSLFMYLSVAETGFEVASFNTAFLCEENKEFIGESFQQECMWRFWNESAHNNRPHPHALNKMGDYYYYGHGGQQKNLSRALNFYGRAAAWNHSHAIFNVASLLERHTRDITDDELQSVDLPISNNNNNSSDREDVILQLYALCSSNMNSEAGMPCYMALTKLRFKILWRETSLLAKVGAVVCVLVTTMLMIFIHNWNSRRIANNRQALRETLAAAQQQSEGEVVQVDSAESEDTPENGEEEDLNQVVEN